MVFQQFSFFVAWLHKTMSTYQFLDMLTCSFPYIPIAKARGFTGISDNKVVNASNKKKKESHYITKNPAVKEKEEKHAYKLYYIESIERKRETYYI